MSTDNDIVKRLSDLVNQATPSIAKTQAGLSITQNGQTYEIPFSTNQTISKTTLSKK